MPLPKGVHLSLHILEGGAAPPLAPAGRHTGRLHFSVDGVSTGAVLYYAIRYPLRAGRYAWRRRWQQWRGRRHPRDDPIAPRSTAAGARISRPRHVARAGVGSWRRRSRLSSSTPQRHLACGNAMRGVTVRVCEGSVRPSDWAVSSSKVTSGWRKRIASQDRQPRSVRGRQRGRASR